MTGRIFLTGAAGRLGAAVVEAFAGCEVIAHTRATLDITDPAGGASGRLRTRRPTSSSTAPPSTTSTARRIDRPRRWRSTHLPFAASRARPKLADATLRALQHRLRLRRHWRPSRMARMTQPSPRSTYAASKLLGRMVRARCAARIRASRREPVRSRPRVAGTPGLAGRHRRRSGTRRRGPGVHRSGRVAELRPRRRGAPSTPGRTNARAGPVSLRELRAGDVVRGGGRERASAGRRAAAASRSRWTGSAQGATPAVLRARQPEAGGRRVSDAAWHDALRRWLAAREASAR